MSIYIPILSYQITLLVTEFNKELFERKYYDWIPYLKAPRKCELNCMPKGERFYYRHAKKVLQGLLLLRRMLNFLFRL